MAHTTEIAKSPMSPSGSHHPGKQATNILDRSIPQQAVGISKLGVGDRTRVLVADDERVIADTLAIILNNSGYEARAAYTGQAAIDAVDDFAPDILISDVIMPGMNGIETAVQILALRPSCRILLFSGQAATVDLLRKADARGHHFDIVAKPIHPAELLRRLRANEFSLLSNVT